MPATDVLGELLVLITGETAQYDKSIDASKKKTEKFEASMKKFGDTANRKVTLPILAMSIAAIKFASDAEESRAKFNTAFAGIEDRAAKTAKELSLQYGLARQSSEKLLGDTGDLLKGFGASADGALDFSLEIQKLAVDLASYNNVQGGASRVSKILTKSVLGNKDGLSELGVSLLDVDIKQELVRTGQDKLTGQAGKLAKAQATFTLILQQTGDAQGDYLRTSDSVANQTKLVQERTKDLAVEFGNILLPAVADILEAVNGLLVEWVELSDESKKVIIGVAGIAAVAGPAVTAVLKLNKAFKLLATPKGGIGLALIAITAIVAGIKLINEANLLESEKNFDGLAESSGKTAKELNAINLEFANLVFQGETLAESEKIVQEQFNITKEELISILALSKDLYQQDLDYYKEINERINASNTRRKETKKILDETIESTTTLTAAQLKLYTDQNDAVQEILQNHKSEIQLLDEQIAFINKLGLAAGKFSDDQLKATEQLQADKKAILDEEAADIEAAILAEAKARRDFDIETLDILKDAREEKKKIREQELKDEKEKFDSMIDLANQYINAVLSVASSLLQIASNESKEELRILNDQLNEEININNIALKNAIDTNNKELASELKLTSDKLALKLEELNIETAAEKELSEFRDTLDQQRRETEIADTEARIVELLASGEIEDAEEAKRLQLKIDNDAALRILEDKANLDKEQRIKDITNAQEDAEAERLTISEAAKTEADRIEAEKAAEKLRIEKEFANKKYKIDLAQFKATQALSLAEAVVTTARGIAASIPNVPLMIASGLAGAFQIGVISSQKAPPKPQLNTGLVVAGSQRGVDVTVGENNQGEIIQGMGSKGAALRKQLAQENARETAKLLGGRSGGITVNIYGRTMTTKRDLEDFAIKLRPALVNANQRVGIK
jgi:hypothetical protein